MKLSILTKLAFQSSKNRASLFFPYNLALIIMFAIEFILLSLYKNSYLQETSSDVLMIIGMGLFFASILIVIISIYSSSFVRKNLGGEYGIYSVLGLEKKHIAYLAMVQLIFIFLVTSLFSVALGYSAGHFIFRALNLAMQNTGMTVMDYPFSLEVVILTLLILGVTIFLTYIIWIIQVYRLNPMELMKSHRKNEGEPKSRWLILILALLLIGIAYWIALTVQTIMSAMLMVYVALLLVILGTFLLFLSFITIVLKAMKRTNSYYSKPNWLISVSGMLVRIRNSAVSLASISILVSGVILVMTMTLTVYRTLEHHIENISPTDFKVEYYAQTQEANQELMEMTKSEIEKVTTISNYAEQKLLTVQADLDGNHLNSLNPNQLAGQPVYLIISEIDNYNKIIGESISLEDDQVLISSNILDIEKMDSIKIIDQTYQTIQGDSGIIPSNYGIEVLYIAVEDEELIESLKNSFKTFDQVDGEMVTVENQYTYESYFDVEDSQDQVKRILSDYRENPPRKDLGGLNYTQKEETSKFLYELYGGLVFIGLIVSAICVVGTILMLYFKQISEGYADQGKFEIMKKVGLPEDVIKQSIKTQLVWIFILPILVAVIHNIFASKMIYKLLGLMGLNDPMVYATSLLAVTVTFIVIYILSYLLSSRAYYKIVNR